jgi:hypothetical protein
MIVKVAERVRAGDSVDDILRQLSRDDWSLLDTVVIIRAALGVGLGEAKRIVHTSPHFLKLVRDHDEMIESIEKNVLPEN